MASQVVSQHQADSIPNAYHTDLEQPDPVSASSPSYNSAGASEPLHKQLTTVLHNSTTTSHQNIDGKVDIVNDSDDMLSVTSTPSDSPVMDSTTPNVPALPAKSRRRASRLLATLPAKSEMEDCPILTHAAPHIVYLSSEEDASSSADDFSDFEDLSDSEAADNSGRRTSHEDVARVVSVVFSGKPSIVNLPPRSTSPSTASTTSEVRRPKTSAGPADMGSVPSLARTLSINSTTSASTARPVSRLGSFDMRRPTFLKLDPFAAKPQADDSERPKTPKTPTTMIKRTLSLVRKRSKPSLNQSFREGDFSPMEQLGEEEEDKAPTLENPSIKRKATSSPAPVSPSSPKNFFGGLSKGRRMSIKA